MPDTAFEIMSIERIHNLKYLGISLDRTLAFTKHTEKTTFKARQRLAAHKSISYLQLPTPHFIHANENISHIQNRLWPRPANALG